MNFQNSVASFRNIGMIAFARSSFDRIELFIESITVKWFVKSHAFGIQRAGYHTYSPIITRSTKTSQNDWNTFVLLVAKPF